MIAYPFVAGAVQLTVTEPLANGAAVGAAGASGVHALITAVVAVGPFPAEVTAAILMKRSEPSTVESVIVALVAVGPGVATCDQFTPSVLV